MRSSHLAVLSTALLALLTLVWSFFVEPSRFIMREEMLELPQWSGAPLRLALLSDLHVGAPYMGLAKVDTLVAATNLAHPDSVVLLGDYIVQGVVGGTQVAPEDIGPHLAALRAPLGVYAILGNHDWWLDGARVRAALEKAGIVVLENEARLVERPGGSFWLLGLADLVTRHIDVSTPLEHVTNDDPIITLSHNPDVFPTLPAGIALTVAGHTHGGQVRLPFIGPLVVPSKFGARYAAGHVEEGGRHLFVTTGLGTSILPVRLGVAPEVVVLTIRARSTP